MYVIGGGELKIDTIKVKSIMKWMMPTNVFKGKSFIGKTQYMRKFIASFVVVTTPLHAITMSSEGFQWEKG